MSLVDYKCKCSEYQFRGYGQNTESAYKGNLSNRIEKFCDGPEDTSSCLLAWCWTFVSYVRYTCSSLAVVVLRDDRQVLAGVRSTRGCI